MPDKGFLDQVKRILKRIPGIQGLNEIRHHIIRIRELSNLCKENRIVVLHPYSRMKRDEIVTRDIVHDVVINILQIYGTVRMRRTTAAAINSPTGAIMLYAPLVLLQIPASHEDYLAQIGKKTRNMIRKAEKHGYKFREFIWNDYLDDIFEINTSKEVRQSIPMRGWYREPVQPRHHSMEELQYRKYYGAFKDEKLCAYLHVVLCGDFAFFRHFIGHAQHLPYGIMNGLLSWMVREYIGNTQISWFNYGEFIKSSSSMYSFRKHAGFQVYATLLDLDGDQELLKDSNQKVKMRWHL